MTTQKRAFIKRTKRTKISRKKRSSQKRGKRPVTKKRRKSRKHRRSRRGGDKNDLLNLSLINAAKDGNLADVKSVILSGATIDGANERGTNALMAASGKGHEDIVQYLMGKGAKSNNIDTTGTTALMWASNSGHDKTVEILLKKRLLRNPTNVNIKNKTGKTALDLAIINGNSTIVDKLILAGATVPNLLNAVTDNKIKYVKVAVKNGANINQSDSLGDTALIEATNKNFNDIVEELLTYPDLHIDTTNNDSHSALMIASQNGNVEIVEMLLRRGADSGKFAISAGMKFTALSYAKNGNTPNHAKIVKLLSKNVSDDDESKESDDD